MTFSPESGPATSRVIVRLHSADVDRLDAEAKRSGTSRSAVVRGLLALLDPVQLAATVAEKLLHVDGGPE
jgi:Ribbon-helix-helix protein, copG family